MSIAALLLLSGGAALGADPPTAREHYDRGTTLYDLQRFAEAAKEYEAAYELKSDPALLFNIGQAYRFATNYDRAILAFRSYLRRIPRAPNRTEVEARIAEMQKLLDEQRRHQQAPPLETLPPKESRPSETEAPKQAPPPEAPPPAAAPLVAAPADTGRTKKIAGLAVGVVGLALAGAGAGMMVLAKNANDELASPAPGYVFNPATESNLKTYQALGIAFLAIGGAAVVTGVVVAALGFRESRARRASLSPSVGPGFVAATVEVGF